MNTVQLYNNAKMCCVCSVLVVEGGVKQKICLNFQFCHHVTPVEETENVKSRIPTISNMYLKYSDLDCCGQEQPRSDKHLRCILLKSWWLVKNYLFLCSSMVQE